MSKAEKALATMRARKGNHKTEEVLRYLMTHKRGLTPLDAWRLFGAYRLGSIISNLRHIWGLDIETIPESQQDGQPYARYILMPEEEESA